MKLANIISQSNGRNTKKNEIFPNSYTYHSVLYAYVAYHKSK